jgi:hypothetical protein
MEMKNAVSASGARLLRQDGGETCWCSDKIFDTDLTYVLEAASEPPTQPATTLTRSQAWIAFLGEHPTRGGIAESLLFQAGWEAREAAAAPTGQWVKVETRLPEDDERVCVWNSAVGQSEHADYADHKFIDESGTKTDLTDVVTHWKPQEAPPVD